MSLTRPDNGYWIDRFAAAFGLRDDLPGYPEGTRLADLITFGKVTRTDPRGPGDVNSPTVPTLVLRAQQDLLPSDGDCANSRWIDLPDGTREWDSHGTRGLRDRYHRMNAYLRATGEVVVGLVTKGSRSHIESWLLVVHVSEGTPAEQDEGENVCGCGCGATRERCFFCGIVAGALRYASKGGTKFRRACLPCAMAWDEKALADRDYRAIHQSSPLYDTAKNRSWQRQWQ